MLAFDIEKCRFEMAIPHIAASMRKISGCPSGDLVCEHCGDLGASENRQRTAYQDSDNMCTLCPTCQKESDEYWGEMWAEYYSNL
jgi:hypothetical protein